MHLGFFLSMVLTKYIKRDIISLTTIFIVYDIPVYMYLSLYAVSPKKTQIIKKVTRYRNILILGYALRNSYRANIKFT